MKNILTKGSQIIAFILLIAIFGLAFGPAIVTFGRDGGFSDSASVYEATNYMFRGPSAGLLSAWILVAVAGLISIILLVLGKKAGAGFTGGMEIFQSMLYFTAGMLFCWGRMWAYENIKGNGANLTNMGTNNMVGWGIICIACVCFVICIVTLLAGGKKLSDHSKALAAEEDF